MNSMTRPGMPDLGDIPKPIRRTYETVSALLPTTTDQCTLRSTVSSTLTASGTSVPTYNFTLANSGLGSGSFDQYRIEAIRFSILPQNNAVGLVTNAATTLQKVYCVIDYDDSTALASVGSALQYNNCITLSPGESLCRLFQPHMAIGAYSGAFTSFANVKPMWVDAASTGVQHYGIKLYIPGPLPSQPILQTWDVNIEYWITFRNAI